jgi:hypothetical protein
MPVKKSKTSVGSSTRRTTDFKQPTTKSGKADNRYTLPQFTKKDGTRDKRCTQTSKR